MNPVLVHVLKSAGLLMAGHAVVSTFAWIVLRSTGRHRTIRAIGFFILLVLLHLWIFRTFSPRTILLMGVLFFYLQLGYVFRMFSSLFWYRKNAPLPSWAFFTALTVWGPRQHYGAGSWSDLNGSRTGKRILLEYGRHVLYSVAVVAVAIAAWKALQAWDLPLEQALMRSVFFVLGLELLSHLGNFQMLTWAPWGKHQFFFGEFAWIRSQHIGQFWSRWNTLAVRAFREFTVWSGLKRRYFANTMTVFLLSGLLHQIVIFFYTRKVTYGTLLSFLLHGLAVYAFSRLYRSRRTLPGWARILIFNPVTSAIVVLAASQPFVMDVYGQSFVLWDPATGVGAGH